MFIISKKIEIKNTSFLSNQIITNGKTEYTSTENDNLSILESGKNKIVFNTILQAIQQAQKMICIQSFLIQDSQIIDALLEKATTENIKVYVLSSADVRLSNIDYVDDFIKSDYIKLLETKFKNNFIFRSSENFHAKYILIDPNTNNFKGYLCTNNFTNNGFFKNIELTISLNKMQCEELFKVFVYHFWEYATHEQDDSKTFDFVKPKNHFKAPNLTHLLLTSPNNDISTLEKTILINCENANKSISISTYNFEIDNEIIKLLIEKSNQNVNVTLFCHPKFRDLGNYKKLSENGVIIILHEHFHAKSLVIDNENAFVFTGNLDKYSMKKNLEIGIELDKNQTNDLIKIHNHWKTNLSYTFVKETSIQDIHYLIDFSKDGISKKNIENSTLIDKTNLVKTVHELIVFFNLKNYKTENTAKSTTVALNATIQKTEIKDADFTDNNFFIIKDASKKMVIVNKNFVFNDISKIEKYKTYNLFYKE